MNKIKSIISYDPDIDLKSWKPQSNADVYTLVEIEIGPENKGGGNLFYVKLATPEALIKHEKHPFLVKNRTIVMTNYDFRAFKSLLIEIVDQCSRDSWEETCVALQRYFQWEYEENIDVK